MKVERNEMECRELRDYLMDGEGEGKELPPEYREHLKECRSCSMYFQSLRIVDRPSGLYTEGPADLRDRVMARLARESTKQTSEPVRWMRLAAAAVLLVALGVAGTLGLVGGTREGHVVVHLHLTAPGAEQVAVVGDWNEWEPGSDLLHDKDGDGVWETRIEVPEGREYRYQFLIDGEKWVADPGAAISVDDGFGGKNSILDI
jgi:hypothetical protein